MFNSNVKCDVLLLPPDPLNIAFPSGSYTSPFIICSEHAMSLQYPVPLLPCLISKSSEGQNAHQCWAHTQGTWLALGSPDAACGCWSNVLDKYETL